MPKMAEWFGEVERRLTIPGNEGPFPMPPAEGTRTPNPASPELAAPPTVAPPTTSDPTAPALSPSLRAWLLQYVSGHNVLSDEMYNYFGGDDILKQLQQFDPNAKWTPSEIGGGEGGGQGTGRRLDFDVTKLPAVGGPGLNNSIFDTGFKPVYDNSELYRPEMTYDDKYYGTLTPGQNVKKQSNFLETYGPYIAAAIAAGGPALAGLLVAGGIGGAAGLTASVTGSGLAAGANAAGSWIPSLVTKAPALANAGASYWDPPKPVHPTTGNAVTPYDPTAYGAFSGGSTRAPSSNDSSLVATAFADDPYGFSDTRGR